MAGEENGMTTNYTATVGLSVNSADWRRINRQLWWSVRLWRWRVAMHAWVYRPRHSRSLLPAAWRVFRILDRALLWVLP